MKPLIMFFAVLGLAACGNYSNEDLDFQLALPEPGELEAKLPQALTLDNSSEYYKLTRQVVTEFNGIAVALVSLVDKVRSSSPTSRNGAERVWGPFPDDKHPGWQIRVLMRRVDDSSFGISYSFQIRQIGPGFEFFDFMNGDYLSSGSARRGAGNMHLYVDRARAAGYPVDDFGEVATLDLCYRTRDYPMSVHMDVTSVETAKTPRITYDYAENADASGALIFDWTVDPAKAVNGETDITFVSRWIGSGAGRADAYATRLANFHLAADCWGPDTIATYVSRLGQPDQGSESLCAYALPTEISHGFCPLD